MPLASAEECIPPRWAQPHHYRVEKASGMYGSLFSLPLQAGAAQSFTPCSALYLP